MKKKKKVCKTWNKALEEERFWTEIAKNYIGNPNQIVRINSFKFLCVWNHLAELLIEPTKLSKFKKKKFQLIK